MNLSKSFLSSNTAILSCDSDMATSVAFIPLYFNGTTSKSISKLFAISPMATDTPPAPKSLLFLINFDISGFAYNLTIFLSIIGFPFCTSAE